MMRTIIVTGSAGLIGSETVRHFGREGARVIGIDNDMRAEFFGAEASTKRTRDDLIANIRDYEHRDTDIRDAGAVMDLFKEHRGTIEAIIHTAAQPSHDWAARDPHADFSVNAIGTLNLLEASAAILLPRRVSFSPPRTRFMATRPIRLPLRRAGKALGNRARPRIRAGHFGDDEH